MDQNGDLAGLLDTLGPLIGEEATRQLWASVRESTGNDLPTAAAVMRSALAAWLRTSATDRDLADTLATVVELLTVLEAVELLTSEKFSRLVRCARVEFARRLERQGGTNRRQDQC